MSIAISIWATVGLCATAPSASFNAVPLTGAYVTASSGSGFAAATLSSAAKTVHDWCNVANAEGSNQCKKCTPLPKSAVIIALSVTLPCVFVLVLTMWWTGFCCCPPPANSCGARRRAAKEMGGRRMMASAGYSSGPTGVAMQSAYVAGVGPVGMNSGYVAGGVPTTVWNASPPITGYTPGGSPVYATGALPLYPQMGGGAPGYADPRKF